MMTLDEAVNAAMEAIRKQRPANSLPQHTINAAQVKEMVIALSALGIVKLAEPADAV